MIPGKVWARFRRSDEFDCALSCAFLFLFELFIVYILARGRLSCRSISASCELAARTCESQIIPQGTFAYGSNDFTCCVECNEIPPQADGLGFLAWMGCFTTCGCNGQHQYPHMVHTCKQNARPEDEGMQRGTNARPGTRPGLGITSLDMPTISYGARASKREE